MKPPSAALAAFLMTFSVAGCAAVPGAADAPEPLVVFLVRHAEKVDRSRDPALSPAGQERATALAHALCSVELDQVHSSDYRRTRDTAAATAAEHGLAVELYNPRDLGTLANRLQRAGGHHLVVGHSNTTPALVELLGGAPGAPIEENDEYDRLYFMSIPEPGATTSVLLRYGTPRKNQP